MMAAIFSQNARAHGGHFALEGVDLLGGGVRGVLAGEAAVDAAARRAGGGRDVGDLDVDWRIDEFLAVQNDDDKAFVGTLGPGALFTPAADGPNPARRFGRNNYGDVWVVATAKTEKDRFGQPLTARAYLVVAVPSYQRWDQPEVAQ